MTVDRQLLQVATQLLSEQDPSAENQVCAAYLSGGKITVAFSPNAAIAPELKVIEEAKSQGSQIAAIVTIGWSSSGAAIVLRPSIAITGELVAQCRRHASVGISGAPEQGDVDVQPLWKLLERKDVPPVNDALQQGRYGAGMKGIAGDLQRLARDIGVPHVNCEFAQLLLECLRLPEIRSNAGAATRGDTAWLIPEQLESISLRHVWLALEEAVEVFASSTLGKLRAELAVLQCNQADLVHIKQGFEAFRNITSVLVVFTGTREQPANECPFYPYDSSLLTCGTPLKEALILPRSEAACGSRRQQNAALIEDLITMLSEKGEGGFTNYLRQRKLYSVDTFRGQGAGHCPFSAMSNDIFYTIPGALREALDKNLILLEP